MKDGTSLATIKPLTFSENIQTSLALLIGPVTVHLNGAYEQHAASCLMLV